jgi:hypothetical protein
VLACFLATLTAYVERVGFSIAFTEMAKQVRRRRGGRRQRPLAGWPKVAWRHAHSVLPARPHPTCHGWP